MKSAMLSEEARATKQSERNLQQWKHNVRGNFQRTSSRRVVLTELSEAQRLEVEEAWGILLDASKPSSAWGAPRGVVDRTLAHYHISVFSSSSHRGNLSCRSEGRCE